MLLHSRARNHWRETLMSEAIGVGDPAPAVVLDFDIPKPALVVWLRHVG